MRGRPIENRSVGLRMDDPPLDLARLAVGQGAIGFGPCASIKAAQQALQDAVKAVQEGKVAVIDISVAPEYARATSNAMLRQSHPGS